METLYHYCSNHAFVEIIKNRKIWLSSLLLSNDTLEGKLASDIFAALLNREGSTSDVKQLLIKQVEFLERVCEGTGFCLSEEGDLLSQWRGYAENASGVSIGFSKQYLVNVIAQNQSAGLCTLEPVIYDRSRQEEALLPTFRQFKEHVAKTHRHKRAFWQ